MCGYTIPSPAHLPDPEIESGSPALQADYLPAELPGKPYSYPSILTKFVFKVEVKKMVAQMVKKKKMPAMQETWAQSQGQEDPLEKVMATHSSFLAWRISWTVEPGGLQSTASQRVRHD